MRRSSRGFILYVHFSFTQMPKDSRDSFAQDTVVTSQERARLAKNQYSTMHVANGGTRQKRVYAQRSWVLLGCEYGTQLILPHTWRWL